jgi:hypothetical protein
VNGIRLRIPGHVVYRELVRETAIFNLRTGAYHSLPRAAGVVLALIERHGSVDDAAEELAHKSGRPLELAVSCLTGHCTELGRAGLLELDDRPPGTPPPRQGSRAA